MAHDIVVERLAAPNVDLRGAARIDVIDEQIDGRVRRAGLGVRFELERRLHTRQIRRQEVIGNLRLVEAVVRELAAVGRPPHRGFLLELFAVRPAGRSVLHTRLGGTIRRDGGLAPASHVDQPHIAVAIDRFHPAVRRQRRLELASAFRFLVLRRPSIASSGSAQLG